MLVEVHGVGEVEVFRTEGPVGVMWLDRGDIRNVLSSTEHYGMVVMWITMA